MSWKSEGGGRPHQAHYWSFQRNCSPSQSQTSSPHHWWRDIWQAELGDAEYQWWSGEVPEFLPGLWGVAFPGSLMKLMVAPVITATSASGTPAAWRIAFLAVVGRLALISIRIWTFLSCMFWAFLFWKGGLSYSESRRWEATLAKAKTSGKRHGWNSCSRQKMRGYLPRKYCPLSPVSALALGDNLLHIVSWCTCTDAPFSSTSPQFSVWNFWLTGGERETGGPPTSNSPGKMVKIHAGICLSWAVSSHIHST